MADDRDAGEVPLALQPLRQFRQQTEGLRAPPGAKERAFRRLGGGDAALEQFRDGSAEARPPVGAKERVFARIEAQARRGAVVRPRARLALAFVCVLVASSVGAMTLPGARALPFRLLPSLSPLPPSTPTLARPSLQRPSAPASTPASEPPAASPDPPAAAASADPPVAAASPEQPAASTAEARAASPADAAARAPSPGPIVAPAPPPPVVAAPGEGKARPAAGADTRASDDTLAQQVGEYQRALALAGRNDQAALSAWRAFVRRWPTSPLRHEADLQIVAALGRLGRRDELEAAARGFLREHPQSPRSGDVRKVLRASEHLPSNEPSPHARRPPYPQALALVASSLPARGRGPRARALHRRRVPRLVRSERGGRRGGPGRRFGWRGQRRRRRGRRRSVRGRRRLRVGGRRGRRCRRR